MSQKPCRLKAGYEAGLFAAHFNVKASYVIAEPTAQEPGRYRADRIAALLYRFDLFLKLASISPHLADGVFAPFPRIEEFLYPALYSLRLVRREQVLYGLQVAIAARARSNGAICSFPTRNLS